METRATHRIAQRSGLLTQPLQLLSSCSGLIIHTGELHRASKREDFPARPPHLCQGTVTTGQPPLQKEAHRHSLIGMEQHPACELADSFRCNSPGPVQTTLASVTPSSLHATNWGGTGQSAMPCGLSVRGGSCDEAGEGVMYKG
ncbi:hypothetical protein HaLaN_20428, partial [Haematococcus lacustris]